MSMTRVCYVQAICGVCHKSTKIPSSNFTNSAKHAGRDASESMKKFFYDMTNKPCARDNGHCVIHSLLLAALRTDVTCPRCGNHMPVPDRIRQSAKSHPNGGGAGGAGAAKAGGAPAASPASDAGSY